MELAMNLLMMLGGVAVFMYGMKQMSQGIEQGVGTGVRKLFKKINKNRALDYGIGIVATTVVQSSSATSIMTVGLANAGIVNVKQGAGIILGAKVGTTLTAFVFALGLVSKGSFSISAVFAAVAFCGVVILYTTSDERARQLGLFMVGFGMLFVGLEVMEFAIGGKDSVLSLQLAKLFRYDAMLNPVLLVIFGMVFTLIIQSSTAATGIFLALLSTGVINSVDQSFFLIMGANIGTCSDGLLASLGTNENGKRIAIFHVLTSVMGAAVFTVILAIFRTPIVNVFERTFSNQQWSLATFNLLYNLIYTLILLALLDPMVTLVCKIIKHKEPKEKQLYFIDERLLVTPVIAIDQALKEVHHLATIAQENFDRAFLGLTTGDISQHKAIAQQEYKIDEITRALADYFIKISSQELSAKSDKLIGGLHHVINDIERIGDYAVMIAKETNYMVQQDVQFLDTTKEELVQIHASITQLFSLCLSAFQTRSTKNLRDIATLHYQINHMTSDSKEIHTQRLGDNMYSAEVSKSLYTAILSLQRVADHVVNIGFSIRSDTGSKTEAFASMEKDKMKTEKEKAK